MRTYLEKLKDIESMAKVDEWAGWKKQSYRSMRFGESFERDVECPVSFENNPDKRSKKPPCL